MQLHVHDEIKAASIEEYRQVTGHRYDEVIQRLQQEDDASDDDWDLELVSSVETVLNEAHPDKLVSGHFDEDAEEAIWTIFDMPERLWQVVPNVCDMPLKDMPLYINDPLKPIADLARWRIKKGV